MAALTLTLLSVLALLVTPASATLQWFGDPSKGRAIFDNLNFEGGERHSPGTGSVRPDKDPEYGKIWKVIKPATDKRAEIRGATGWSGHKGKGGVMKQDETYYLGWRYRFEMPDRKTGAWACFQWKSYEVPGKDGEFNQNYPILMSYDGRNLALRTFAADWYEKKQKGVTLWSGPLAIGEWVDIVLVVHVSRDAKKGFVEFYLNGRKQTLTGGKSRFFAKTMDGDEVAPKWGAYNRYCIGTEITVSLADMRIGTDLESVMPKPVAGK